jgi:hypothetical protein
VRRLDRLVGAKPAAVSSSARSSAPASSRETAEATIGGGVFAGLVRAVQSPYLLGICIYMLLYSSLSTFLYVQQAGIVDVTFADRAARTAFFARVDLLVNALTLGAQLFLTSRVMKRLGVGPTLMLVPVATLIGFFTLGIMPSLAIVVAFIVIRRAGNFAFARPSREVLFTVLSREDKYKAKSAIDTVVYRLGDQVGVWSSALLTTAGLGLAGVAWAAVPLSAVWVATAWWFGADGTESRISLACVQLSRKQFAEVSAVRSCRDGTRTLRQLQSRDQRANDPGRRCRHAAGPRGPTPMPHSSPLSRASILTPHGSRLRPSWSIRTRHEIHATPVDPDATQLRPRPRDGP